MADKILELRNIVKTFPGVKALNGVSFDLEAGEIHAICGENGAGKSTLMKVVCGVYKPDSGEIYVNGQKQDFHNPIDAYSKGVSIIFQETSLFNDMTVLDNIYLNHEIYKKAGALKILDYPAMEKNAREIFRDLGANVDIKTYVRNLGMAQKQMTEIAKAFTFHSKIIIFDEPTASLTEREVQALFDIIRRLKNEGYGMVYISHRIEEIFSLCDRVTVIRDGKYISTHNVRETDKDELIADMVGRKMENYYPHRDAEAGETLLEVRDYWDESFLKNISFYVKRGEILGFAGLAGAGRTELMESICGITPKAAGSLFMNGKEIVNHNYRDAMGNGMVYVSEDRAKFGITLLMSVGQNITLPQLKNFVKKLGLLDKKKEDETSQRYIKELGIKTPSPDFVVENLSGGNQQKVSLSKALALQPKIIFMDEPTRGVDVNAKAEIYNIINELSKQGLTIVIVSSEMPELIGMCDRIYIMKKGEIAGCLDRADVTQEKILSIALD